MAIEQQRVLVTGARGAVGSAAAQELRRRGHFVRGFDLRPMDNVDEAHLGDLANRAAVETAVEGMDAVVHLAATPDAADFLTMLLQPNIVGVYQVFEAAKKHGVQRLVYASTVQTVMGPLPSGARLSVQRGGLSIPTGPDRGRFAPDFGERLIRLEDGTGPPNHYAVTKLFGEAMCAMYAHQYGISIAAVRIGWLPREPHDVASIAQLEWAQNIYFSPGDAGRFFACCVEAQDPPPVATLFASSRPKTRPVLDLEPARKWIGYEPQDTWPEGAPHPVPEA